MRFALSRILSALLILVGVGAAPPGMAGEIFATVSANNVIISDPDGVAQIPVDGVATISVFLGLDGGEQASTFDAGFALVGLSDVTADLDLSQVDPNIAPLGIGTWTQAAAFIQNQQARVSHSRLNLGGDTLVLEITVGGLGTPTTFQLTLADGEASFDTNLPPFFDLVPIDTPIGTAVAIVVIPEPTRGALGAAAIASLVACRLRKTVQDRRRSVYRTSEAL